MPPQRPSSTFRPARAAVLDGLVVACPVAGLLLAAHGHGAGVSPHVLWPFVTTGGVLWVVRWWTVGSGVPLLGGWVRRVADRLPLRSVLPIWLGSRLAVLGVGFIAVKTCGFAAAHGRFRVSESEWWNLPARWDAGWYLGIARRGYEWTPAGLDQQQNVAFFPAFPVSMRLMADVVTLPARLFDAPALFGGGDARFLWAGVLVASLAFLGALLYLHALAANHMDTRRARHAVVLTATYPFALFFSAPYTEGLFLLSVVGAFYHFHRRQFTMAAWWALLTGLVRPNGFLLSLALMVAALEIARAPRRSLRTRALVAASMPVVGMLLYSAFVARVAGHPFAWAAAQRAWGHTPNPVGFITHRWAAWQAAGPDSILANPLDVVAVGAVILALVSIPFVARRFSWAYATFVAINLAPPLLFDMAAIGRMTAVLFPMFLWLATVVHGRRYAFLIGVFVLLQMTCAAVFFTWGPLI